MERMKRKEDKLVTFCFSLHCVTHYRQPQQISFSLSRFVYGAKAERKTIEYSSDSIVSLLATMSCTLHNTHTTE